MTKQEFLNKIKSGISRLPKNDIEHYLQYYSEMIDDRMEDGMAEADAVSAMGVPDEIIAEILREKQFSASISKDEPKSIDKSKLALVIIIAVLTLPIWGSVISAAIGIFAGIAGAVIGIYAASFALAVSGVACFAGGVFMLFDGVLAQALVMVGIGLLCAGLSIPVFLIVHYGVNAIIKLSKKMFIKLKEFIKTKKEELL